MDEDGLPLVTAIIPCHNHQDWVQDAVHSIVSQTYAKKRLIVVDDFSTDSSREKVLELLQLRDERHNPEGLTQYFGSIDGIETQLVCLPRSHGPSGARNIGIKVGMTNTDIFAFLDSDDIYRPTKIQKSVDAFLTAPTHIGVVYSDYTTWNPTTDIAIRQYKEPFSRERLLQECIINCDSLVSKHCIETCGGFDEEMRVCEDYDFWMRISEKFIIEHIAKDLVTIRVGSHSSTDNVRSELWNQNYARVFEKMRLRNA